MKINRMILMLLTLSFGVATMRADETVTVKSTGSDISENLDLKAVATLFGECKNLEEFEVALNSEERHLNNLDLNGDGVVDYLRVVEIGEGNNRLIVLQAVLAKDIYQDVASIYVEKQADQTVAVQVIGNEYIYGANYIIEPVFIYRPVIYDWFWGPAWVCWHSPYYWGYYPPHCCCYAPWHCHDYCVHVHVYHHNHPCCSYRYATTTRSGATGLRSSERMTSVSRNDYAQANPERSFSSRTAARGVSATNARQMERQARNTGASYTSATHAVNRDVTTSQTMQRMGDNMSTTSAQGHSNSSTTALASASSSSASRTFGSSHVRTQRTASDTHSATMTASSGRSTAATGLSRSGSSSTSSASHSTRTYSSTYVPAGSSSSAMRAQTSSASLSGSSSSSTATRSSMSTSYSSRSTYSGGGDMRVQSSSAASSMHSASSSYSGGMGGGMRSSGGSMGGGSMGGGRVTSSGSARR